MTDVVMPRLSDTMEEGTILRWLKQDGEYVARGEELVEIETDKASMTYESDRDGIVQTVAREGDTLAVGEPIARIGEGTDNGSPYERQVAVERPSSVVPEPAPETSEGSRVKASPLARRVARESGIDIAGVKGSGPGGRIVKADVQAAAQPSPVVEAPTAAKGETTTVELSRMQRTIARRMAESKATIPDFTLTADIDMEACVELRAELKRLSRRSGSGGESSGESDAAAGQDGVAVPTYNDMIVKACALALREHPRANGSYRDGRFELHGRVNVGVAVAVDAGEPTSGALVVPTVFDADTKALGEIARETRTLAARVRDGQITPPELSGATFTVSNLGMYGIRQFTAIVNPPQAAILAVGEVAPRPVARKKKAVVRATMTATLSCDHRILYGADAALFLARVRELLEEPAALTL